MVKYIDINEIDLIMISEISRLGRKVTDVLNTVELLHEKGIGIYVQQFNMISLENGKENPMVMLLLQVFAMGAQMENSLRAERQKQGIEIAKLKGKYQGRKRGANADNAAILEKYKNVVDLLETEKLSLRKIASITNHSINTIRKVNQLV